MRFRGLGKCSLNAGLEDLRPEERTAMRYPTHNSLDSAASPASPPGFLAQDPILGASSNLDRSRRIGSPLGIPLSRLAKGAALLACALSCVPESSAQAYNLLSGTVSNFSVSAYLGSIGGTYSVAGPSAFVSDTTWVVGRSGWGLVAAYSLDSYFDVVGFALALPTNPTTVTGTGSGSGSFTMDFTASVIFFDLISGAASTPPTSWTVTGLGSIFNGQTFGPGLYTFNFTTTTGATAENQLASIAAFVVPETSPPGVLMATSSLLLITHAMRRRRKHHGQRSADVSTG